MSMLKRLQFEVNKKLGYEYYQFRIGNKWNDCPIIDKHNEQTEPRRPYGVTMECVDNEMYVAFFLCRTPFFGGHTPRAIYCHVFSFYLWKGPKAIVSFRLHSTLNTARKILLFAQTQFTNCYVYLKWLYSLSILIDFDYVRGATALDFNWKWISKQKKNESCHWSERVNVFFVSNHIELYISSMCIDKIQLKQQSQNCK